MDETIAIQSHRCNWGSAIHGLPICMLALCATLVILGCGFRTNSSGERKLWAGNDENDVTIVNCGEDLRPKLEGLGLVKIHLQMGNINHDSLFRAPEEFRNWFESARSRLGRCDLVEASANPTMGEDEALIGFSKILVDNRYPFASVLTVNGKSQVSDSIQCYRAQGMVAVLKNQVGYELPFIFQSDDEDFSANVGKWLISICRAPDSVE